MSEKEQAAAMKAGDETINAVNNRPGIMSSFFALSEKLSSYRYLRWVITALLPVLILLRYPVNGMDYDLWWQMALGKYYLTHHTLIMDHSIFSWTPIDPAWIYNTCLGSISIYLVYSLMGGFGLWLFQWLIFLGIFFSFYLFLRLIHQRLDVTSVSFIAAIGIVCSMACNYYKPELFSFLLFCWTVFIFFYFKITRKKLILYAYPLIFALWVNLHGGFVAGFFFLVMAFTGEILNRVLFARESLTMKELVHLGTACFFASAATLLNPYGIDYLLSTYNGFASGEILQNNYVRAYVSLWPSLKDAGVFFSGMGQTAWIMTTMIFFLFCLFIYELVKKKTCDFALLIINAALYWQGMETGRASYFFPLAFFFTFFYFIHKLNLKRLSGRATILSLLVFVFFFVNISYFTFRNSTANKWFGAGLESFVPVKEVEFLKKRKLEGPVFNDYLTGGYLLWDLYPDYKAFIDPRFAPFRKQVVPDYFAFIRNPVNSEVIKRFTDKYPFKIAIIHYRELPLIFAFLRAGDEWRLLYFEQRAAILIHKSLLATLQPEDRIVDLSPFRFEKVNNPEVLLGVFNFYVFINPQAGRIIYNIYRENVSDYYKYKTAHLQAMDKRILQNLPSVMLEDNGLLKHD